MKQSGSGNLKVEHRKIKSLTEKQFYKNYFRLNSERVAERRLYPMLSTMFRQREAQTPGLHVSAQSELEVFTGPRCGTRSPTTLFTHRQEVVVGSSLTGDFMNTQASRNIDLPGRWWS